MFLTSPQMLQVHRKWCGVCTRGGFWVVSQTEAGFPSDLSERRDLRRELNARLRCPKTEKMDRGGAIWMESSVALQQVKWVKGGRDAGWWPGVLALVTPCSSDSSLRSQYPTLLYRLYSSLPTIHQTCYYADNARVSCLGTVMTSEMRSNAHMLPTRASIDRAFAASAAVDTNDQHRRLFHGSHLHHWTRSSF